SSEQKPVRSVRREREKILPSPSPLERGRGEVRKFHFHLAAGERKIMSHSIDYLKNSKARRVSRHDIRDINQRPPTVQPPRPAAMRPLAQSAYQSCARPASQ